MLHDQIIGRLTGGRYDVLGYKLSFIHIMRLDFVGGGAKARPPPAPPKIASDRIHVSYMTDYYYCSIIIIIFILRTKGTKTRQTSRQVNRHKYEHNKCESEKVNKCSNGKSAAKTERNKRN